MNMMAAVIASRPRHTVRRAITGASRLPAMAMRLNLAALALPGARGGERLSARPPPRSANGLLSLHTLSQGRSQKISRAAHACRYETTFRPHQAHVSHIAHKF